MLADLRQARLIKGTGRRRLCSLRRLDAQNEYLATLLTLPNPSIKLVGSMNRQRTHHSKVFVVQNVAMIQRRPNEILEGRSQPDMAACRNIHHVLPSVRVYMKGVVHGRQVDNFPLLYAVQHGPSIDPVGIEGLPIYRQTHHPHSAQLKLLLVTRRRQGFHV